MPSIRKLKSGRFNVQIRRANQPSKSATFDTEEDALIWIDQLDQPREPDRKQRSTERGKNSNAPSFLELAKRYCDTILLGRSSYKIASRRLERIAKQLPSHVGSISKFDVNDYRLKRLKEVSGVTCRDELQLINRVYRWAHRELILDQIEFPSPCDSIPIPPPSKPRSRVVEKHELDKLLDALSPVMRAIVELAYETAMRRGEIVKLTPRVVSLDERSLQVVDGKTGDRMVPLTKRAVQLLSDAMRSCESDDAKLFPVAPHSVTTAVRRARRKIGLDDDVRLHQLRHTRITLVAKRGLNQSQIMVVSGHRDSRSVNRYTHLSVSDILELID